MGHITEILDVIDEGNSRAAEELLPLVYEELRRVAAKKLAQESPGQTLSSTALVHEAYLRLVGSSGEEVKWDSRGHFFAAAAEAMRRILVDSVRRKRSQKRGGELNRQDIDCVEVASSQRDGELLALDEALDKLAANDRQKADLIKLRYFAGLTVAEAARHLGISTSTAERYWAYARAWLHQEITKE